jgi:hypothetical protein
VTVASLEDRVDGAVRSHRLLVTPEPQLVSVVFGPTLAFLTCAASVLPINLENEYVEPRSLADSPKRWLTMATPVSQELWPRDLRPSRLREAIDPDRPTLAS